MKILILANNDIGLYKFRKELIERLIKDGHKVYLSLPDGEFVNDLKKLGCKYIKTKLSRHGINPVQEFRLLRLYKSILKNLKPDMVFTYTIKPNIYGGIACSSLKIPYVVNITGLGTAVENKGFLQFITVQLYRIGLKEVKTVFFQNKENEKFFTNKNLAVGKHKLLPGSGVNLSFYQPLEYPNTDTIDFVFVGRIMKEKGIEEYLKAAKYIRKKYLQSRFHICGFCEQDYEDKINKLQNKGIIIYHGLVKDMKEIYKQIHCTIHPTYYPEGLSNVLLESAACARPIITTNRSGCREVIEDGKNGFLVRERDSLDVISKIEKFIQLSWKEKKQMGFNGRKKVEKEFDRQIVINQYILELKK